MQFAVTIFCAAIFLGQGATARVETLTLPHALRSGERAWLEIQVGTISRGAEIVVKTTSGRLLGVISPYGVRSGAPAGTYTVPVPPEAISKGQVSVQISIRYYHSQQAPTLEEVKRPRITITSSPDAH
ncbi:MAG TPA: hypothetical protein VJA94_24300 [Candidatus Angelobacter sp.]